MIFDVNGTVAVTSTSNLKGDFVLVVEYDASLPVSSIRNLLIVRLVQSSAEFVRGKYLLINHRNPVD